MAVEDGFPGCEVALEALGGAGQDKGGVEVELRFHLLLPLFGQLGWAENGDAGNLAPVQQLAGNEERLDGLSDAHVITDKEAHGGKPQCHEKGHKLVGPGLDGDPPDAAERTNGAAGAEARGGAEKLAREVVAGLGGVGESRAVGNGILQGNVDPGELGNRTSKRFKHQGVIGRVRLDDPLAAPAANDVSYGEWHDFLRVNIAVVTPSRREKSSGQTPRPIPRHNGT